MRLIPRVKAGCGTRCERYTRLFADVVHHHSELMRQGMLAKDRMVDELTLSHRSSLKLRRKSEGTLSYMVKQLSAFGGCLGSWRR